MLQQICKRRSTNSFTKLCLCEISTKNSYKKEEKSIKDRIHMLFYTSFIRKFSEFVIFFFSLDAWESEWIDIFFVVVVHYLHSICGQKSIYETLSFLVFRTESKVNENNHLVCWSLCVHFFLCIYSLICRTIFRLHFVWHKPMVVREQMKYG